MKVRVAEEASRDLVPVHKAHLYEVASKALENNYKFPPQGT
jgi:hypothetical protein